MINFFSSIPTAISFWCAAVCLCVTVFFDEIEIVAELCHPKCK